MKYCERCLLPESFPGLDLYEKSQCSLCRNHHPIENKGEARLLQLLHSHRGNQFDVVVPISGGKDSTYVLWFTKKILELRPIAVDYNSGFQAECSIENMRRTCQILDVPMVTHNVNSRRQIAKLRSILRLSEGVGCFLRTCSNCENGIRWSAIRIARMYDVPFILHGADPAILLPKGADFFGPKAFLRRIIRNKRFGGKILFYLIKYTIHSALQQREIGLPPTHYFFRPIGTAPWPEGPAQVVAFFDYIQWDPVSLISVIKEELGWKAPEGKESRFDCLLHCFVNHSRLQETGVSSDGFMRSRLLRSGLLSREEYLNAEKIIRESVQDECRQIIKSLGLKRYRMPNGLK